MPGATSISKLNWQLAAAITLAPSLASAQPAPPGQVQAGQVTPVSPLRIDREVGAVRQLLLEAGQNRLLVLSESIGRVSVADPAVADLKVITPTQLLLTAKGVGSTDLTLWTKGDEPLVIALQVARNLEGLRQQLKELFPKEQVTVSSVGDLVVLAGEVTDVRLPERMAELAQLHAGKVANLVRVSGDQQVQLEVKFAEVSRTSLREMGLNFFHKARDGRVVAGMAAPGTTAGNFLNTAQNPAIPGTGPRGPLGQYGGQPPDVMTQPFGDAFSLFFSGFSAFPFSAMLGLLESNGLAKVLAEPTLVTLSGQEAKFLAGGEFPIPLASALGQVNVVWRKFGVVLSFTPTVIASDTIHLKMAAEVSDIDPGAAIALSGNIIPGLTARQSETTVRLGDGQSFAVAGLLSDRVRSNIDKLPLLGDIPIIGALFRSVSYQRDETELLVVITARLVKPLSPHELPPMPSQGGEVPNDFELFLLGLDDVDAGPDVDDDGDDDEREPGAGAAPRGPAGAYGFIH